MKNRNKIAKALMRSPGLETLCHAMRQRMTARKRNGHSTSAAYITNIIDGSGLPPEIRAVYTPQMVRECMDASRTRPVASTETPAAADDLEMTLCRVEAQIRNELFLLVHTREGRPGQTRDRGDDLALIAETVHGQLEARGVEALSYEDVRGSVEICAVGLVSSRALLMQAEATSLAYPRGLTVAVRSAFNPTEGLELAKSRGLEPATWEAHVASGARFLLHDLTLRFLATSQSQPLEKRRQSLGLKLKETAKALSPDGVLDAYIHAKYLAGLSAVMFALEASGELAAVQQARRAALNTPSVSEVGETEADAVVGTADAVTYHIPANYWPWKKLKILLESAFAVASGDEQIGGSAQAAITLFHECGDNFYLVGKQFLDELEETKMSLDGLKIMEEAPLPYKAFLLLFPLGYLKVHVMDGTEREVVALHVSAVDEGPGTASGIWFGCVYEDGPINRMFSTSVGFREDGTLIDTADELYAQHEENAHISPEIQEKLIQSTLHLGSLMTKILAAMAAAPRIVETDVVESLRKAKKGRPKLSFKTPKVIGWKIRYIKRADRPRHASHGGPVAPHWRCKHLRRVPYGPTSVPLEDRPRRVVEIPEVRVNSEYEDDAA